MNKLDLVQLFKRIEKEFNMNHSCDCREWCHCWENFKNKELTKKGQ